MAKFVPREKMSKKERARLDKAKRKLWEADPRPRVKESKKRYDRKRRNAEWDSGVM